MKLFKFVPTHNAAQSMNVKRDLQAQINDYFTSDAGVLDTARYEHCKKIAEIIYLSENDPLVAPALEEGLRKNEAFMHTPQALERYIEVARIGTNTQMARQVHLQQAGCPDPPAYAPSAPPHGTGNLNSLAGLPDHLVRHALEIDGHTPRQAVERLRQLGFQFEVDDSGDWICRANDGGRVLACTNCDKWYVHNPVDCDKPCRMCKSPPDQHTKGCIRYKAWARKHGIPIPPEKGNDKTAEVNRPTTSQFSRGAQPGDRRRLQLPNNSKLGNRRLTPEQSSRLLVIIEQFARIAAEAAQPVSDEHAQRLDEQAEFVAALHEQAVDTILATPEEP
jgi:hypothetical protein